jgi:hypothetical protein
MKEQKPDDDIRKLSLTMHEAGICRRSRPTAENSCTVSSMMKQIYECSLFIQVNYDKEARGAPTTTCTHNDAHHDNEGGVHYDEDEGKGCTDDHSLNRLVSNRLGVFFCLAHRYRTFPMPTLGFQKILTGQPIHINYP